jgi:tRNA pseudouridine32 synthase/23S rRNA pseudouridine746 synthase
LLFVEFIFAHNANLNLSLNIMDVLFNTFELSIEDVCLPINCSNPFNNVPHELGRMAAEQLQRQLTLPQEWAHNFGLVEIQTGPIIGKMFGVLVVKNTNNNIGFLKAFSGKIGGTYTIDGFVPPIYDSLTDDGFLTSGMIELSRLSEIINALILENFKLNKSQIDTLKKQRSLHSSALQDKLFEQYSFLNQHKEVKSLTAIFYDYLNIRPSSGAGDCTLPKLMQYAYQNNMRPLAMAEFWWGLSPKSVHRQHLAYYPACQEKCEPILRHMLQGIKLDSDLKK